MARREWLCSRPWLFGTEACDPTRGSPDRWWRAKRRFEMSRFMPRGPFPPLPRIVIPGRRTGKSGGAGRTIPRPAAVNPLSGSEDQSPKARSTLSAGRLPGSLRRVQAHRRSTGRRGRGSCRPSSAGPSWWQAVRQSPGRRQGSSGTRIGTSYQWKSCNEFGPTRLPADANVRVVAAAVIRRSER